MQLLNFDRCRTLYNKFLEFSPEACEAWIKYSSFEVSMEEVERARAIFELAIEQPLLDMPELLWKAYIGVFRLRGSAAHASHTPYGRL